MIGLFSDSFPGV